MTKSKRNRNAALPASEGISPKNQIRQWEVAAFYHAENILNHFALDFVRRLDAGATIEAGEYSLERDHEFSINDSEFRDVEKTGGTGFGFRGFSNVTRNASKKPSRKTGGRK